MRVWSLLRQIPHGKVTTYGIVAEAAGTKAVRAVASAIGKNPDAPKTPCHRAVRSDGRVGGYSAEGGTKTKCALLTEEGIEIRGGKIIDLEKYLFRYSVS